MKICISTFPRSGSSFLKEYLNMCTDIPAIKDHRVMTSRNMDPEVKRLFIVRNPLDSIASVVAMEKIDNEMDVDDLIERNIHRYEMFYSYADNYDIVISYEQLVSNTDKAIDDICRMVNGTKNDTEYVSQLKRGETSTRTRWGGSSAYVVSSKTLEEYEGISKRLKNYDLSKCDESYRYAHSKISDSLRTQL
jgi:hypothetical protein